MVGIWNRLGNKLTAYDVGYHYADADGSKYFSNADGCKFYDPGPSGKGRTWFCSPDGVKTYIDDDGDDDTVIMEEMEDVKYEEEEVEKEAMWNTPIKTAAGSKPRSPATPKTPKTPTKAPKQSPSRKPVQPGAARKSVSKADLP